MGLAAAHHPVGLLWRGLAAGPRCYAPPLRFTRPGTHRPRGGGRLEPLHAPQSRMTSMELDRLPVDDCFAVRVTETAAHQRSLELHDAQAVLCGVDEPGHPRKSD